MVARSDCPVSGVALPLSSRSRTAITGEACRKRESNWCGGLGTVESRQVWARLARPASRRTTFRSNCMYPPPQGNLRGRRQTCAPGTTFLQTGAEFVFQVANAPVERRLAGLVAARRPARHVARAASAAGSAVERTAPGGRPITRLKARLKAAWEP